MTDRAVSHYVGEATRHPPTPARLAEARIAYQQRLLQECWDFDDLGVRLRRLIANLRSNLNVIDMHGADAIDGLERQVMDEIVKISTRFRRELRSLYRADRAPEDDDHLQERVRRASAYFDEKLRHALLPWIDAFAFETDNKALRKTLRKAVDDLRKALAIKTACTDTCRERFSTTDYLNAVAKARIDALLGGPRSATRVDPRPGDAAADTQGPGLPAALRRWRARTAEAEERDGITHHQVLTRAVLRQIADTLPQSPAALAAIKGIGKRSVERYGKDILAIVAEHRGSDATDASGGP
jgi:superfamily II DNA helicase RecQ